MKTAAQIKAQIAKIVKRDETLADDIQDLLVDMTEHAFATSDVSSFGLLIKSVKSADKSALMAWASEYAPVRFSTGGAVSLNKGKFNAVDFKRDEFVGMCRKWYQFAKSWDDCVRNLDALAKVRGLVESLQDAIDNPIVADDEKVKPDGTARTIERKVINADLLSYIESAIAKYEADHGTFATASAALGEALL